MPKASRVAQHFHWIDASRENGHRVSIGREQPVLFSQCQRRTDLACFLAAGRCVYRKTALPGKDRGLLVETTPGKHLPIHRQHELF
jgi:hypothetical protein